MTKTRNHWYGHFGYDFSQKNSDDKTQRDNWMFNTLLLSLTPLKNPGNMELLTYITKKD